jgi:indole-3-glycerol phosphate synthase
MDTVSTILDQIVATKRKELDRAKALVSESALRQQLPSAPPVRDFAQSLAQAGSIGLIAEVKKASPSKGVIRENFDPVAIAQTYERHGAACISVLTDEPYFQGSLVYLSQIRQSVEVPLLRKDFIIDPYQVAESRVAGADAVLLIAECLDQRSLQTLYDAAVDLGMAPLVEFYDPDNLPQVLNIGAKLVGINNRNLHTFEVDLEHTVRLRGQIPEDRIVVAESGVRTRADVEKLSMAGVRAMLVGESLMAQPDIGVAVDRLLGTCQGER